jgi:hypothetical protein
MRDLYKRLNVTESATDPELRTAVAAADPSTREAAETILLQPKRREVYDRNRRVLSTVGRLRANLGLNLTRFWPRNRFADFTTDLTPQPTAHPQPMDPMAMAWAFGVQPPASRRWRRSPVVVAAVVATLLLVALFVAWRMTHAG